MKLNVLVPDRGEIDCLELESLEDAIACIDGHHGLPDELVFSLPESLFGVSLSDGPPVTGVAAVILTDRALRRGWLAKGSQRIGGRRIWKFGVF